jgi:hypothetical protein
LANPIVILGLTASIYIGAQRAIHKMFTFPVNGVFDDARFFSSELQLSTDTLDPGKDKGKLP